jgi:hypothetical protein
MENGKWIIWVIKPVVQCPVGKPGSKKDSGQWTMDSG